MFKALQRCLFVIAICALSQPPGQAGAQTAVTDAQTEQRVDALLQKLSMDDKLQLLDGYQSTFTHPEPTIGLPALKLSDGPLGLRGPQAATAFPAGIALAATFDTDLAYEEGRAIALEARAHGGHFLLGPGVNLYRAPMNGRNFEYFGEDPFLSGQLAASYVIGVQKQGLSAVVKHFALNNEEYDRHNIDSIVDERTLHELYLPAFEAAVTQGHVGSIMDSYNLINGEHATQNETLNVQIADKLWGFRGLIMSDWNSVYDGVAAANAGLDLELPSGRFMTPEVLKRAISAGTVTQATVDDKVRRLLRLAVRMGWMDAGDWAKPLPGDEASRAVALQVAKESVVLLKNENSVLPLNPASLCRLAVIGPNADAPFVAGGGSSEVKPLHTLSLRAALQAALPPRQGCPGVVYLRGVPTSEEIFRTSRFDNDIQETLFAGDNLSGALLQTRTVAHTVAENPKPQAAANYHSGRWLATYTPQHDGTYLVFVAVARKDSFTLKVDGKTALSLTRPEGSPLVTAHVEGHAGQPLQLDLAVSLHDDEPSVALGIRSLSEMLDPNLDDTVRSADAVVLSAGFDEHTEGEGFDRTFALPAGQDRLIQHVAALNSKTVVVLNAGGGVDMSAWLSGVPALLHAWYPGQEGARALTDILLGRSSPEGHLPISMERSFNDNPVHRSYYPGPDSVPGHPEIELKEGLYLGYRFYTTYHVKPLFPFGFGLSYTQFRFANLHADVEPDGVLVTADVTNTGKIDGGEAVQLYVSDPSATISRPAEELKGFRKVHLHPGETAHVELTLDKRAFQYWDAQQHAWRMDPGEFILRVGDASDNLPLQTSLTLPAHMTATDVGALQQSSATPPYNGTKEYSLIVMSTRREHRGDQEQWAAPQGNKTRVIEQLAGFHPQTLALDKWGGRLDKSEPATGFFYTKKIGDRWWAIDPEGHPYLHMAVVSLSPGNSATAQKALTEKFGDTAGWMAATHTMLLKDGFDGAGAWSKLKLIRESPLQKVHPIAYTLLLDFMANYARQRRGLKGNLDYTGFPNDTVFVFDPAFPEFVDQQAQALSANADDPALFGYTSDNELPFKRNNLDGYLALPHSDYGYIAARQWMAEHHASTPNDDLRKEFLGYVADRYYSIVSSAIHKYDPNHMFIGSRITGRTEECPEIFHALGKYAGAISVNYYEVWTPDQKMLSMWENASGKPVMITEFYVKGMDTGMSNTTGAGWLVGTQRERGMFYQDYALQLIQSKYVIGWHWFMYQDNDPANSKADASNRDSNKGIVDIHFEPYTPLLERMRQINTNAYALADYFDSRPH